MSGSSSPIARLCRRHIRKKGYPRTEVKYVVNIDEAAGRGTATFEIKESPKIRIAQVQFPGAQAFPEKVGFFENYSILPAKP